MASSSSSSSHPKNKKHGAFSEIETSGKRRKVDESSKLFDVFINHRGPDVKHTLALHLYNSLKELGINPFLDSEEKELGDSFPSTIENAIYSASAHIAIFSEGYADSPWCLAELALMSQSRAKIIPVFYGVKPSALRYIESGEYAKAFTRHEEKGRYEKSLKDWKETLHTVSFLAGYETSCNFNISDCQNIVSAIQKEVQRKKSLRVAKYPVGLHRLVKDFESSCLDQLVKDFESQCLMTHSGKEKAQIVGIFGMGGVGKTTLAKELFNKKHSDYTRACFLFDVREADANMGFTSLQMKLLKDIYRKENLSIHCVEEGTSHIAECIKGSNQLSFLIVLDDIDKLEQLDALLIRDMLNKSDNSLVIVTTRDAGVLINAGITVAYNLKGMNESEARELFCWHAFRQSYPSSGYEELVDVFVNVCSGLPLSLQVLGSHVCGTEHAFWELELQKINKTLPRDILKRLRISVITLDDEEKQIFMDVACFFIGEFETDAIRVWEASGWSAQHALIRLKNKCLVEEHTGERSVLRMEHRGERSVLRMHDHLRDLGREMAVELSSPHRLWHPENLQSLRSKGLKNILAQPKLRCLHSFKELSLGTWLIKCFLGESVNPLEPSTALLWLELKNGSHELANIPPSIPLQNVQNLMISSGSLQRLWPNNEQVPFALKELRICRIRELEVLSMSLLHSLEVLVIQKCRHLKTLTGISDLKNLEIFNIGKCPRLDKLSLFHLHCLKEIKIDGCGSLKILTGISDLRKLEILNIGSCGEFEEFSLFHLHCLKEIKIDGCGSLKSLTGISGLTELQRLEISYCDKLKKLSLAEISCLKEIRIHRCAYLKIVAISDLINLAMLDIVGFGELEKLSLVRLNSVKRIIIYEHEYQNDESKEPGERMSNHFS